MQTYSVNIGLPTESTSYPIQDYLNDILLSLQDNESKLVNPRDLRDSILSLWSSTPFKETTASGSSIAYIGLDSNNTSDRDIKSKIYLGKRAFSGTYSYTESHNIMNDSLLSSDVDTFLFNTRIDTQSQTSTRISILAGNDPSLYKDAPYIGTQLVSGTTQSLALNIVNPSILGGNINITSDDSTEAIGYTASVIVNNIEFPTPNENTASASNDKVLFSNNNKLYWDSIKLPSLGFIGNTGSQLDIYGEPTNINGYSLEFSDTRRCPVEIGDISYGDTFNNNSLSETLRRIIFDYLGPTCEVEIIGQFSSGYSEVGTYPIPTIQWTLNKKTLNTQITGLSNMIPGAYPPIISNSYETISGTSTGVVISPITATSTEFRVTISDGIQTASASTEISGIYPYFYGFSPNTIMTSIGLAGLTKLVEPNGNKTVDITGDGNLYFIYDADYGTLSNIYDNYGNTASGSFSSSTLILSSPTGLWAAKEFYVYQWDSAPQIGPPSVNYQFVY
jgi:hypothetical protein